MGLANIIKININGQFKFIRSKPLSLDDVLEPRELPQFDAVWLIRLLGLLRIGHQKSLLGLARMLNCP